MNATPHPSCCTKHSKLCNCPNTVVRAGQLKLPVCETLAPLLTELVDMEADVHPVHDSKKGAVYLRFCCTHCLQRVLTTLMNYAGASDTLAPRMLVEDVTEGAWFYCIIPETIVTEDDEDGDTAELELRPMVKIPVSDLAEVTKRLQRYNKARTASASASTSSPAPRHQSRSFADVLENIL